MYLMLKTCLARKKIQWCNSERATRELPSTFMQHKLSPPSLIRTESDWLESAQCLLKNMLQPQIKKVHTEYLPKNMKQHLCMGQRTWLETKLWKSVVWKISEEPSIALMSPTVVHACSWKRNCHAAMQHCLAGFQFISCNTGDTEILIPNAIRKE